MPKHLVKNSLEKEKRTDKENIPNEENEDSYLYPLNWNCSWSYRSEVLEKRKTVTVENTITHLNKINNDQEFNENFAKDKNMLSIMSPTYLSNKNPHSKENKLLKSGCVKSTIDSKKMTNKNLKSCRQPKSKSKLSKFNKCLHLKNKPTYIQPGAYPTPNPEDMTLPINEDNPLLNQDTIRSIKEKGLHSIDENIKVIQASDDGDSGENLIFEDYLNGTLKFDKAIDVSKKIHHEKSTSINSKENLSSQDITTNHIMDIGLSQIISPEKINSYKNNKKSSNKDKQNELISTKQQTVTTKAFKPTEKDSLNFENPISTSTTLRKLRVAKTKAKSSSEKDCFNLKKKMSNTPKKTTTHYNKLLQTAKTLGIFQKYQTEELKKRIKERKLLWSKRGPVMENILRNLKLGEDKEEICRKTNIIFDKIKKQDERVYDLIITSILAANQGS